MRPDLKINQRVKIELEHPLYGGTYSSRVEEILPGRIVLAAPLRGAEVVPLRPGDRVTVSYWSPAGAYTFKARVSGVSPGGVPLLFLEEPEEVQRVQRRSFLRVPAALPVTFSILEDIEQLPAPEVHQGETVDISGGGVLLRSPVPLREGDYLELEVTVPKRGTLGVVGRVVRVQEKKGAKGPEFYAGVDFVVIAEADRDKIVGFVFERQREMRRKGLI